MKERITVTATRRETELQKTPVAVTAVSEQTLNNAEVETIEDLMAVAPSLQITNGGNPTAFTARIRGIGTQGNNAGLESAVGTFIDGVYRARAAVAMGDLGELQAIEVLRGPQGTLFGRNTSAGILNVYSKKPEFEDLSMFGSVTVGSFDKVGGQGGANFVAIEDTLAVRLFGIRQETEGFIDVNPGRPDAYDGNATSYYSLRGQALWQLSDQADIRFIADYSLRADECCSAATMFEGSGGFFIGGGPSPADVINAMTGPLPGKSETNTVDEQIAFGDRPTDSETQDYGFSGEVNYEFEIGTLTSITAFRQWKNDYAQDPDFSAADILYFPGDGSNFTRFENFTQEVRFAGEAEIVDYLFGFFYSDEDITRRSTLAVGAANGICPGLAVDPTQCPSDFERFVSRYRFDFLPFAPSEAAAPYTDWRALTSFAFGHPLTEPLSEPNTGGDDLYRQNAESFAIFTHDIWHLADGLDLTTGLRYTSETKTFNAVYFTPTNACSIIEDRYGLDPTRNVNFNLAAIIGAGVPAGSLAGAASTFNCLNGGRHALDVLTATGGHHQDIEENEFSGIATLAWEIDEDVNTYATYSRGHKAGGFNLDRIYDDNNGSIITTTPDPGNPPTIVAVVACPGTPPGQPSLNCFTQTVNPVAPLSFIQTVRSPDTSFAPEFVDAYELGLKLALLDDSLFVNTAVFYQVFENFQLNTFTGLNFVVTSVPEVISQGVEVESFWNTPVDGLSANLAVQYTDAHYGDIADFLAFPPNTGLFLLRDAQLTHAPEWVVSGGFDFEFPLFMDFVGLLHADARWQDDMITGSNLDPRKRQEAFAVVGAKFAIFTSDETLTLEIFGRNLFDERYINTAFDSPLQGSSICQTGFGGCGAAGPLNGSSTIDAFLGEPRTIGATLKVAF
jgi:iron complex outermembrane recepter protein